MEFDGDLTATSNSAALRDSFSSNGSSISASSSSISILNDCTSAWISYLNALNNLCAAGSKLGNVLTALEQSGKSGDKVMKGFCEKSGVHNPTSYLTNSWNDLARATAVATSTVKAHITAVLQDFVVLSTGEQTSICEAEQKRIKEHNDLIITENAQTMINIQHQFCAASCDAFASLTCCFICQSPVGFPHEQDCIMIKQKYNAEQRSQTPSPNFGGNYKADSSRGNSLTDQRPFAFGSLNSQLPDQPIHCADQARGLSPLQAIFENTKGPLPNPGHLLAMKIPFYRGIKSPLNFPLFPLNGQRRWSEAAAGEVGDGNLMDAEIQMRRWSMPWEASKTEQNTVTWYQTRIMPENNFTLINQKTSGSERSIPNTPDLNWRSSAASNDGLTEAIQLLSCRPHRTTPSHLSQVYHTQHPDTLNNE